MIAAKRRRKRPVRDPVLEPLPPAWVRGWKFLSLGTPRNGERAKRRLALDFLSLWRNRRRRRCWEERGYQPQRSRERDEPHSPEKPTTVVSLCGSDHTSRRQGRDDGYNRGKGSDDLPEVSGRRTAARPRAAVISHRILLR